MPTEAPAQPAKKWLDLRPHGAGLWLDQTDFVITFLRESLRDAVLDRWPEICASRELDPAILHRDQHGPWPALRLSVKEKDIAQTLSIWFSLAQRFEMPDYKGVKIMRPEAMLLPSPRIFAGHHISNGNSDIVWFDPVVSKRYNEPRLFFFDQSQVEQINKLHNTHHVVEPIWQNGAGTVDLRGKPLFWSIFGLSQNRLGSSNILVPAVWTPPENPDLRANIPETLFNAFDVALSLETTRVSQRGDLLRQNIVWDEAYGSPEIFREKLSQWRELLQETNPVLDALQARHVAWMRDNKSDANNSTLWNEMYQEVVTYLDTTLQRALLVEAGWAAGLPDLQTSRNQFRSPESKINPLDIRDQIQAWNLPLSPAIQQDLERLITFYEAPINSEDSQAPPKKLETFFELTSTLLGTPQSLTFADLREAQAAKKKEVENNPYREVKVVYQAGSSKDRIEDFGKVIPFARKAQFDTLTRFEEVLLADDQAVSSFAQSGNFSRAQRKRLWPEIDLQDCLEDGMDPRKILMLHGIQQSYATSYKRVAPAKTGRFRIGLPHLYESPLGLRIYIASVTLARTFCEHDSRSLFSSLGFEDPETFRKEQDDLANGKQYSQRFREAEEKKKFIRKVIFDELIAPIDRAFRVAGQFDQADQSERSSVIYRLITTPGRASTGSLTPDLSEDLSDVVYKAATLPDDEVLAQIDRLIIKKNRQKNAVRRSMDSRRDAEEGDEGDPVEEEVDEKATPEGDPVPETTPGSQVVLKKAVASHLQHVERMGLPDWRNGQSVTSEALQRRFGFVGGQFGNWVPNKERQTWIDMTADAMEDFCTTLEIPPQTMGLGHTLGVAWGARGRGGHAAAHYEPGVDAINLTRKSGAGSLAHEWAHALDHWLCKMTQAPAAGSLRPFVSESPRFSVPQHAWASVKGIREDAQILVDALRDLISAIRSRRYSTERFEERERIDARALSMDRLMKSYSLDRLGSREMMFVDKVARENLPQELRDTYTLLDNKWDLQKNGSDLSLAMNRLAIFAKDSILPLALESLRRMSQKQDPFPEDIENKITQSLFQESFQRLIKFHPETPQNLREEVQRETFRQFHAMATDSRWTSIWTIKNMTSYVISNREWVAQFGLDFFYQANTDKSMGGKDYWASNTELLARLFDAEVAHRIKAKGGVNSFLCRGNARNAPSEFDLKMLRPQIDAFFDAIRVFCNKAPVLQAGLASEQSRADEDRYDRGDDRLLDDLGLPVQIDPLVASQDRGLQARLDASAF